MVRSNISWGTLWLVLGLQVKDYPWASLEDAVVVDVGGGVGRSIVIAFKDNTESHEISYRWIFYTTESVSSTIEYHHSGQRSSLETGAGRNLAKGKSKGVGRWSCPIYRARFLQEKSS